MRPALLICAAIDLDGGKWFEGSWDRIVASLKLGRAGPIRHFQVPGASLALREDVCPGTSNPRVSRVEPAVGPDGVYTLLAGRLTEKRSLCRELGIPETHDDRALYQEAYRLWGEQCDRRVTGEYAAVQWFPEKRLLRLARSPLRAPPLHVWREGQRIAVASLPRSIFAAGVVARLNEARLADAGLLNFNRPSESYYHSLARVPCGAVETHDPIGRRCDQWWSLSTLPPVRKNDPSDYIDAVREALGRAVSADLDRVTNPAISLSSGLDSQSVAVTMLDLISEGERLVSFTSVPVEGWLTRPEEHLVLNEAEGVKALARQHPRLDVHFLTAEDSQFGQDLDSFLLLGSWPSFNEINMHWIHEIYRQAALQGCNTLFNGDFGDAGFSYDGQTLFPDWLAKGKWWKLVGELAKSKDERSLARHAIARGILPYASARMRRRIDTARGRFVSPFESWCPLDQTGDATADAIARAGDDGYDIGMYDHSSSALARNAMLSASTSEGPEIGLALRLMHGIETRSPLSFRPLFELCAGIPDEMFFRDGTSRWLARQVVAGRVPPEVETDQRTAIQSADFLGRADRDRKSMLESIESVPAGSTASRLLDLPRLKQTITVNRGPESGGGRHWAATTCAVPRGIALARFAQFVEGQNHGS